MFIDFFCSLKCVHVNFPNLWTINPYMIHYIPVISSHNFFFARLKNANIKLLNHLCSGPFLYCPVALKGSNLATASAED